MLQKRKRRVCKYAEPYAKREFTDLALRLDVKYILVSCSRVYTKLTYEC